MTVAIQPQNLASMIDDMQRRLIRLESYSANAMTQLSRSSFSSGAGLAYTTAMTDIPATVSPTFTIVRPLPIFVLVTMAGFYGTGGTASYVYVRGILETALNAGPASDINGLAMTSGIGWQTVGSGVANQSANMSFIVAAGTYQVIYQYAMQGGAATTFGWTQGTIDIFQLGG